ncbi:DUF3549 family protein [Alteromonas sp. ASW11-36]|uniref:DUF3549 family protein n=1 Tax=Alteromonas arenosi TaxID=3055817 RepID=A0ABT7SVL7_9ALTE|nr:DUF3549 family protein [Alteromonas sp. ASW11-36]MDM7860221.1 DUF3549 family protein [Alteromonas sp. ASW11-36]
MSQPIASISEFLLHAGTEYRVFDFGRAIRPLTEQQFLDIENGQIAAPYPRQQHMWLGIVYWNKQLSTQHYIWFIKLPLDEQGLLVDAARQHFLELVVTALSEAKDQGENDLEQASQIQQNPYIFTPNQQQLADFNALVRVTTKQDVTDDFESAKRYLEAPKLLDWQQVSMQGLADCIHFAQEEELLVYTKDMTEKYPATVQQHILCSLENRSISDAVTAQVVKYINWHDCFAPLSKWALRAFAQTSDSKEKQRVLTKMLKRKKLDVDLLTIISGRHWQVLDDKNMMLLLEHAAKVDADNYTDFFASFFADLAQVPDTRDIALAALRNPERSVALAQAIGALFNNP